MRKGVLFVVLAAIAAAAMLFVYPKLFYYRTDLKIYFRDADGLRAGAPVRLAGVEVGRITAVRARPDMQAAAAEASMRLETPYELRIPSDSTVSLRTAGVLGETFATIHVEGTSGPPAKNGAVLEESPTKDPTAAELIDKLASAVQRMPCAPQGKDLATASAPKTKQKSNAKDSIQ